MSTPRTVVFIALSALFISACKPSAQTSGETPESEISEASRATEAGADKTGTRPVSVALSSTHGCARHGDGAVTCWPLPEYERDDDAVVRIMTSGPELDASVVAGVDDATELVAGDAFVCANRGEGSVDCWNPAAGTPAKVLDSADQIDAYGTAVCGASGKSVVCATAGESGFATAEPMTMPKDVADLEVGGQVFCVRYADDTAECRKLPGVSEDPQLEPGMGSEGVVPLENVAAIDAGDAYVCALIGDQHHCWGEGFKGRGDAAHTVLRTKKVIFFPGARFTVMPGNRLLRESVIVDKPNFKGEWRGKKLGLTTMATAALLAGFDPSKAPTERFSDETVGFHSQRLCVIQPDGAIGCAVEHRDFTSPFTPIVQTPAEAPVDATFEEVTKVGVITYARAQDGSIWAMGLETEANERFPNWWSGLGYLFMRPAPLEIDGIEGMHGFGDLAIVRTKSGWEAITGDRDLLPDVIRNAETLHSSAGRILCGEGEPGSIVCVDSMSWMPTEVALPGKLVDVARSSLVGVCFLNDEGDVYCDQEFLKQGSGDETKKPTKIGVSGATRMATAPDGLCIAKSGTGEASEIVCGKVTADGGTARAELETLTTLEGLQDLVATSGAVCAVFAEGKLTCWGRNRMITLHDELTANDNGLPKQATPEDGLKVFGELPPVSDVALALASACALTTEGKLWCWGNNASGATGRIPPYVSRVNLD